MSSEIKLDSGFRFATPADLEKILFFIKELAEYEGMLDEVVATEALLNEWLFEKRIARVIFALEGEREVGFALFFYNFSTFLGRAGIYLEDLFVFQEFRGCGYGKKLLVQLAKIAKQQDCGRLEWSCLNWNESSIQFYLSLGAMPMEDWTLYRVSGKALESLAVE